MQNIFNQLDKLHTPEWFYMIKPFGIVNKITLCFKFLLNKLPFFRGRNFRYKHAIQRKGYSLISWNMTDITDTTNMLLAGGKDFNKTFPYRVYCTISAEVLGCAYTDNTAIKNIDYIIDGDYYWFREHPSKYCYAQLTNNIPTYYTVAFCSNYMKLYKTMAPLSDNASSPKSTQIYDNIVTNHLYGVCNQTYLQARDIYTTKSLHGKIIFKWVEHDITFCITESGNFIHFKNKDDSIIAKLGSTIKISYKT